MVSNKANLLFVLMIILLTECFDAAPETTKYPSYYSTQVGETKRCFGDYGCFSITEPWISESRPVTLFPAPPEVLDVKYPIFTRRNLREPVYLEANDTALLRSANIDNRGPFYIISHGYLESGNKPWIEDMMKALLHVQGNTHATVIVVDWRGGSSGPYTQVVANIRLVGAITAHLLYNIYEQLGLRSMDNFHFIGHSLGAHLAGYAGYTLQEKFGLKLGRITGLDPAEPHFARTDEIVRLDRSDAKYVDVVHSDAAGFTSGGFGITEPIGHVDFFPNGGKLQPGCDTGLDHAIRVKGSVLEGFRKYLSCNHVRSHEYFTESINPACPFFAIQCPSYEDFENGSCFRCDLNHVCIPFGYHSKPVYQRLKDLSLVGDDSSVTLYTKTGPSAPYCRAMYRVTVKISDKKHDSESSRLWITLAGKDGDKSEKIALDEQGGKYHKPGSAISKIVGTHGAGFAPVSAILELEFETSINPFTWRLFSSPKVYVEWIRIQSLEYNSETIVCPNNKKPITKQAAEFKMEYCTK